MRIFLICVALVSAVNSMSLPAQPDKRQESGGCKKITFLYARGTGESGTMGASVGPRLSNALGEKFGKDNVKTDGVSYPADVNGATSGAINPRGSPGSKAMADMVKTTFKSCPKTNVVLSGYSQGAEQVHGALMNLGTEGTKITAAVTFGDPLKNFGTWGSLPKGRTLINCDPGDGVCGGKFSISEAHMAYMRNGDIPKSTEFIAKFVK